MVVRDMQASRRCSASTRTGRHHPRVSRSDRIRCDSPADVDAVYAELIASGVGGHKEPWDAFWGARFAQVRDPDGNVVAHFAPLRN